MKKIIFWLMVLFILSFFGVEIYKMNVKRNEENAIKVMDDSIKSINEKVIELNAIADDTINSDSTRIDEEAAILSAI